MDFGDFKWIFFLLVFFVFPLLKFIFNKLVKPNANQDKAQRQARAQMQQKQRDLPQRRPGHHDDVMEGKMGREVREFLDNLRDEYETPKAEIKELHGDEIPDPAAAQGPAATMQSPPIQQRDHGHGRNRDVFAREARGTQANEWSHYELEVVEPEPQQQSFPPPAENFRRASERFPAQGPPSTQPQPTTELTSTEASFMPTQKFSSVGEDSPRWLSLSEILQTEHSDKILGIPIEDAMALNMILGPPRSMRPWNPGKSPQG